ncbi:FAD:protein FMN transferase [Pseudoramibacter porci]|uniref:FAD:protein FMN transferase n=1 Tax=Pseudoramibacter porci TaxID=2606631 RepID=A0A7X2TAC6_9FIRM|nr:FAD:protein FMN transferase [Pseudoramibacter porci]MSS19361.1 FAD:protein FMN transferase [Pseudoramibacter porci]
MRNRGHRRSALAAALVSALLIATGCSAAFGTSNEPVSRQVIAMTTVMNLKAYGKNAEKGLDDGEKEINRLDQLLSVGSDTSEVSRLNGSGGGTVSADLDTLLKKSRAVYRSTGGAFDITVYPLMDLWGFTKVYNESDELDQNKPRNIPTASAIAQTLERVGADKISYDEGTKRLVLPAGTQIDFGGIAKGYTSQRIVDIMKKDGVTAGNIELGGNVQVFGKKPDGSPWTIGLTDPKKTSRTMGVLTLTEGRAVVTSGGYERYITGKDGKRYHHILDPKTGYPAKSGIQSVTIVCKDGTTADALSTAMFVLGKDKAIAYWKNHAKDFEMILLDDDKTMWVTSGLKGQVESTRYKMKMITRGKS